jgi:hypothetical protein
MASQYKLSSLVFAPITKEIAEENKRICRHKIFEQKRKDCGAGIDTLPSPLHIITLTDSLFTFIFLFILLLSYPHIYISVFFSFSVIRSKSLLWRLTFNISWWKPLVEYFVYKPTKQELWNVSNVHRSETIKLKKPAVGNLVRRNLVSRHWTRVKRGIMWAGI